tara:strand:+ start:58 stop:477 length:420 start_codon:yes stop_codon:yes gene_type:complete
LVEKALNHFGVIYIPAIDSTPEQTPLCRVTHVKQKHQRVTFDEARRVDKQGSIVDFIIKKNSVELLLGLWDKDFVLTDDHRRLIEKSGRSYLALMTDNLTIDNMEQAIKLGDIRYTLHDFKGNLSVITWVNHSKYGWQL